MSTILVVDDDRATREGVALALGESYTVLTAADAEQALAALTNHEVDLVLTDLRMPGRDGLSLLREIIAAHPALPVILLSAYGSVESAVEAMKDGAYDFLTKPVNLDHLELVCRRALRQKTLERQNARLRTQLAGQSALARLIGSSEAMAQVRERIEQAAPTPATVLIQGPSGTGKELVARAIHALSPRAQGPFVAVHCAALAPSLLESELFGHVKGAFTGANEERKGRFELADGGTLFLDEIGEISLATQVKLLRVLETQKFERVGGTKTLAVDVRVVAATNRDLKAMAEAGTFREDLYYRLNVINIRIPPLRERREDIPLIIDHYLKKCAADNGRPVIHCGSEALATLSAYDWPGNVRELRNCVERMVVFAQGSTLTLNDVPVDIRRALSEQFSQAAAPTSSAAPASAASAAVPAPEPGLDIHENEKALIIKALEECGGNRSQAAIRLRISRRTLHRKLNEYGIV